DALDGCAAGVGSTTESACGRNNGSLLANLGGQQWLVYTFDSREGEVKLLRIKPLHGDIKIPIESELDRIIDGQRDDGAGISRGGARSRRLRSRWQLAAGHALGGLSNQLLHAHASGLSLSTGWCLLRSYSKRRRGSQRERRQTAGRAPHPL